MFPSGREGPDRLVAVCHRLANPLPGRICYFLDLFGDTRADPPLGCVCCFLELFGDVGVMDSAHGLRYTVTHSCDYLRSVLHYILNYLPDCAGLLGSSIQHIEDQANASAGERPNHKTLPYVLH